MPNKGMLRIGVLEDDGAADCYAACATRPGPFGGKVADCWDGIGRHQTSRWRASCRIALQCIVLGELEGLFAKLAPMGKLTESKIVLEYTSSAGEPLVKSVKRLGRVSLPEKSL